MDSDRLNAAPLMQLSYTAVDEDIKHFVKHSLRRSTFHRVLFWFMMFFCAMWGFGNFLVASDENGQTVITAWSIFYGVVAGLCFVAFALLAWRLVPWITARRQLTGAHRDLLLKPTQMSVYEDRIDTESERAKTSWSIKQIQEVVENKGAVYLYVSKMMAIAVPPSAFADDAARQEFVATVKSVMDQAKASE